MVKSLATSPTDAHVLCSGSHDGCVRVWDVRSVKAGEGASLGAGDGGGAPVGESMFVLKRDGVPNPEKIAGGEGVKVFGVAWDERWGIVSCGEDKRVQINREARR